ncbi:MAG: hypothetical protein QM783_07400 [Phycisphaerales bacterium]
MHEPASHPVKAWRRRRAAARWLLRVWIAFAVLATGLYLVSIAGDWRTFWVTGPASLNASGDATRGETHARLSDGCFWMVTHSVYNPSQSLSSFDRPEQPQLSKTLAWHSAGSLRFPSWPQATVNGWPAYWKVPLWPAAAGAVAVTVLIMWRRVRRPKAWQCKGHGCRYDLRGLSVRAGEPLVCPECGRMNQCPVCGQPTGGVIGAAACAECGWRVSAA